MRKPQILEFHIFLLWLPIIFDILIQIFPNRSYLITGSFQQLFPLLDHDNNTNDQIIYKHDSHRNQRYMEIQLIDCAFRQLPAGPPLQ